MSIASVPFAEWMYVIAAKGEQEDSGSATKSRKVRVSLVAKHFVTDFDSLYLPPHTTLIYFWLWC